VSSLFCFYGAMVFGLLMAIVLLALREPMLALLGASGEVIPHAAAYYSWFIAGAPFVIFSLVPTNLLRTAGGGYGYRVDCHRAIPHFACPITGKK